MPAEGDLIARRYRLVKMLGSGGMGSVFAARHELTGRDVAVKVMASDLLGDTDAERRFEREAQAESSIEHPGVVRVFDAGREGDFPFIVMELLVGESLGDALRRGPLPVEDAIAIMLPVLDAVGAAHRHGVIHRDLKPDNIFLSVSEESFRPKVLDFGISKFVAAETQTRLTATGVSLGTPLYMSPEQVLADRPLDARSDVYSLGVILYQMVTGQMPYRGNNFAALVLKILEGQAEGVCEIDPSLPRELDAVVRRAMHRDLAERYPDTASLAADLRALTVPQRLSLPQRPATEPGSSPEPTPYTTAERRVQQSPVGSQGRGRLVAGALAAVAVVAVLASGFLLFGTEGDGGAAASEPAQMLPLAPGAQAEPGASDAPAVDPAVDGVASAAPPQAPRDAAVPEDEEERAEPVEQRGSEAARAQPSLLRKTAPGERPRRSTATDSEPVLRVRPRKRPEPARPEPPPVLQRLNVTEDIIDPFED